MIDLHPDQIGVLQSQAMLEYEVLQLVESPHTSVRFIQRQ